LLAFLPFFPIGVQLPRQRADALRLLGILVPDGQVAGAEEVQVIVQEFFEAGAGYVGQLDFHLLLVSGLAALDNVLLARAAWTIDRWSVALTRTGRNGT
jgi:hypothetical protein